MFPYKLFLFFCWVYSNFITFYHIVVHLLIKVLKAVGNIPHYASLFNKGLQVVNLCGSSFRGFLYLSIERRPYHSSYLFRLRCTPLRDTCPYGYFNPWSLRVPLFEASLLIVQSTHFLNHGRLQLFAIPFW